MTITTNQEESEIPEPVEDNDWIPETFRKGGYQGYKIFIDRYTLKKPKGEMELGDLAIIVTERHPKFPKKELGWVAEIDSEGAVIDLVTGGRHYEEFDLISVPAETTPEQVKDRVARALSSVENDGIREHVYRKFYKILLDDFIPGGRVLAGAGTPGLTLNNCLSAETRVVTGEGVREISSLAGEEALVLTSNGKWVMAKFDSYGVQSLMKVTLSRGNHEKIIFATPEHRWFIVENDKRSEVQTQKLEAGRVLSASFGKGVKNTVTPSTFGIAAGIVFGDGTKAHKGSVVRLCGAKNTGLINYFNNSDYSKEERNNDTDFIVKNLPSFMKDKPSLSESKSYLYGWLAGYFAADGHVDKRGQIMLHSSNITNLEFVKEVAYILGIGAGEITHQDRVGIDGKESRLFKLPFMPEFLDSEFFVIPEHRERFLSSNYRGSYKNWTVVSVEHTDRKEEVFCADVPGTHSFTLDGNILTGNCYVIPSPKDSRAGILASVAEMVETHARGGGVGINLSSLRPRYGYVKGVNGTSSGAVSWGKMWNLATGLVEQGGSRRGATMLMINDWHPDVEEFIHAKETPGEFENTNMSVCISDEFMRAVEADEDWHLVFPDTNHPAYDEEWDGILSEWTAKGYPIRTFKTVKARTIWDQIITSAWENAEPGLHFLEHSNKMSNSWYFAPLVSTNPCGEQPLEAYGVCTLGAVDLSKFVVDNEVDWWRLNNVVKTAVRFLDNVIDLNNYHFEEIKESHTSNRRIGLGHMGLGEMLIRLGIRYGSDESVAFVKKLQLFIAESAYAASVELAAEKGSFPKFDAEKYVQSGFIQNLPEWVQKQIADHGIRNVCILTQAPNGTTGTMMGTSTGIEPYFAFHYTRTSRLGVHEETVGVINELGLDLNNLPEYCVTAQDLTPMEHLNVQAALQEYVDSAISKTTNVPADWTVEQVQELYLKAWHLGCKGITIYRDGSRHEQVLTVVKNAQTQDNNCEVCGEVLISVDGCVSCPNGCFSKCELF